MNGIEIDNFTLSGVVLSRIEYLGETVFEMRMPVSEYQDPAKDTLRDRNFMAWLPVDFSNGTIEVELASDLDSLAPAYARGFIGLAYRIDAEGRFESIYVRPTNSACDDQVTREAASSSFCRKSARHWLAITFETPHFRPQRSRFCLALTSPIRSIGHSEAGRASHPTT